MFIARGIENRKRSKKSGVVAELIDHWNHVRSPLLTYPWHWILTWIWYLQYFFHPRQLNITLAQGRMILSGPDDAYPPADVLYRKSHNTGHESYDDDSSDSSSDSGHEHSSNTGSGGGRGLGLSGRRAARRERLTEKRAVRSEKREKKRERKSVKNHNFRLVISYRPLTIWLAIMYTTIWVLGWDCRIRIGSSGLGFALWIRKCFSIVLSSLCLSYYTLKVTKTIVEPRQKRENQMIGS